MFNTAWGSEFTCISTQKLGDLVRAQTRSLGDTEAGREWCLKALHPSDPIADPGGYPDGTTGSSIQMNYQSTYTLRPQTGATGTWSFDLTLLPNPIQFAATLIKDSVSTDGKWSDMMNTQLVGGTFAQKMASLTSMSNMWRLTHMSITIIQDGPDLANQGTLVASQCVAKPTIASFGMTNNDGSVKYLTNQTQCFRATDQPTFNVMQAMPNAYYGKSKDGCYLPLRLDDIRWRGQDTCRFNYGNLITNEVGGYPIANSASLSTWPYTAAQRLYTSAGNLGGDLVPESCNSKFGYVSVQNLSVQTSMSVFIRAGYEFQCPPASLLSSQQKLCAVYDPRAIESYQAIVMTLKDAYPADYNDLGKLWESIKSGIRTVIPHVVKYGRLALPLLHASPLAAGSGAATKGLDLLEAIGSTLSRSEIDRVRKSISKDN